jgi:hypothetical protein
MEASVDPYPRGPVWMPITPKTGSLFHADSHVHVAPSRRGIQCVGISTPLFLPTSRHAAATGIDDAAISAEQKIVTRVLRILISLVLGPEERLNTGRRAGAEARMCRQGECQHNPDMVSQPADPIKFSFTVGGERTAYR